jgi:hypothetical protein
MLPSTKRFTQDSLRFWRDLNFLNPSLPHYNKL